MTIRIALFFALAAPAAMIAQNRTAPRPPTIETQDVPPAPVELAEDLARYNNSRPAAFRGWHPGRREILITTRFGERAQLHRVAQPGGARRQLTFSAETVMGGSFSPADERILVNGRDIAGTERFQIYRTDLRDGRSTLLTDGKSRNGPAIWSNDGRKITFSSTRRNGRDGDVYVMDPLDPATTRMVFQGNSPGWSPMEWAPDDGRLLLRKYISINESQLHLLDLKSGVAHAVAGASEKVRYQDATFSKDGRGLYISTDRNAEFCRLSYLDLSTASIKTLRPGIQWDVYELALSSDGRYLAYVVNEDGSDKLRVMDTASEKDAAVPALPAGVMSANMRWRKGSHELGFTLAHARSPGDVYSVDLDSGKLDRWTFSETGGIDAETFNPPELIHWKSFDERAMSGFLYRPPERFRGPRPVVIEIHGGPESQSRAGYLRQANYWVNELGIAVIFPNVRGSDGYGKTFLQLDNGKKREDSVKDIGALLNWIEKRTDLDSKRIMVMGGSYGGYMTLASMVHFRDRIRCAVELFGISNYATFLKNTEDYRRDLRRAEYGDERDPGMRDFFESIAPANHADKFTKPILIVQGKNDPRVPASESEQMAAAIRKNGGKVWYLAAVNEGHGFTQKSNIDYQNAAIVLFIKQFLLD